MKRFLLLLVFLSAPFSVLAQSIKVRTGEHTDFSRLVVVLPQGVEWVLGKRDADYVFKVADPDILFDTRSSFERLPRNRVVDLDGQVGGELIVATNGASYAEAVEMSGGMIVIDVRSGSAQVDSPFETPLENDLPEVQSAEIVVDSTAGLEPELSLVPEAPPPPQIIPLAIELDLPSFSDFGRVTRPHDQQSEPKSGSTMDQASALGEPPSKHDARVRELELSLLEQIGRAASEGLLVPSTPLTDDANAFSRNPINAEEPRVDADQMQPPAMDPLVSDSHISIETAVQKAANDNQGHPPGFANDGTKCLPSSFVAVDEWGPNLADGLEFAMFRGDVVDELDALDPTGALQMAKYYLFLTFGAEAKALISQIDGTHKETQLLLAIADLMDNGFVENPGPLSDQYSCDTSVALWSALAQPQLTKGANYNEPTILSTFSALPEHLRRHFGPTLARKFADIGDTQTASHIENVFSRRMPLDTLETRLLDASLAAADDKDLEAEAIIEDVIRSAAPKTPETLIDYVTAHTKENSAVAKDIADLAEAMAVEFRGHDLEQDLVEASIRARILADQPFVAMAQMDRAMGKNRLDQYRIDTLRIDVINRVVSAGSDVNFLKVTFANAALILGERVSKETRDQANTRLENLGFTGDKNPLNAKDAIQISMLGASQDIPSTQTPSPSSILSDVENESISMLAQSPVRDFASELGEDVPTLEILNKMLADLSKNRAAISDFLSK